MSFFDEIRSFYGLYENNITSIRNDSTLELFTYILKNPINQLQPINLKSVQIGSFYIIKYDYNGNKLWCPILTIPPVINSNETGFLDRSLKVHNSTKILYAVNFDYLPLQYKIYLIDTIINNNKDIYDKNKDKIFNNDDVSDEFGFKVNWIYNFLKAKDKSYSITAYDITKIISIYKVSSTILHRFVFFDTYYVNNRLMYDTLNNLNNEKLRIEFSNKIKKYEDILKIYEKDVSLFYKSLRNFEKNLKLMDEI